MARPELRIETSARILLVAPDARLRGRLVESLSAFATVDAVTSAEAAVSRMADSRGPRYQLILADLAAARVAGRTLLGAAGVSHEPELLVFSEDAALEDAVAAMRCGASDLLLLPQSLQELPERLADALDRAGPAAAAATAKAASGRSGRALLVAESEVMRATVALARRVAPLHSTVLLTGETGTGKELIAALIHDGSPRAQGPFVKVNCAALPETLLESELFGHERGAFTGAERRRVGRFEQASAGTLFLDEIGEIPTATQVKLLRVLQEGEYHRLGGVATLRTEARIVAATNRDLGDALREGRFREDLFFRLNVVGIHLAPLRERPEDTRVLAEHFLADLCSELARSRKSFSPEAMRRLCEHRWSGNVRELRNVIERAVLMSDRPRIEGAEIVLDRSSAFLDALEQGVLVPGGLSLRDVERELVLRALDQAGYVQKQAAKLLGITRRKLNYMIRQMGLTHPSWRTNHGPAPSSAAAAAAERSGS